MEEYDYAVIGCGVFGLSTALELSRRFPGKSIVAFDAFEIPSPWSAANDYNKIIRAEYSDIVYAKLALEALDMWENDPILKNHFVKCGRFTLSPSNAQNSNRLLYENKGIENLIKLGVSPGKITLINNSPDLVKIAPEFANNTLFASGDQVEVKYNPDAGYGMAKNSLIAFYELALENGVKFKFGENCGKVSDISESIITTLNSDTYKALKTIVAMGAATGYLINLENQINSTGLFVTHLQLTDEEYEKYKNIPIFFSAEHGYFFPPDPTTKKLKFAMTFCDSKNTVYNAKTKETSSLPRYKTDFATDTFPNAKGVSQVKTLLSKTLPDLVNHELVDSKTCWISDTIDSDFLIDFVPNSDNSVLVVCGDSGHGYKFLGNIGRYIVDKLEGTLQDELKIKWKWRANPVWPTDMKSRAKRDHLEISEIHDWHIESSSKIKL